MSLSEDFQRDGVVQGIRVLATEEALRLRRGFERVETALALDPAQSIDPALAPWRSARHPLQRIFQVLALHPRVRSCMAQLLGPDLLVRNGDVFIKQPGCAEEIAWHVDTSFPWDQSEGLATCWIGLTPASQDNGGVQYITRSHRHVFSREPADRQHLTLSSEMVGELDLSRGVQAVMEPGQMAAHAFRTVHRSEPNRSDDRRIGMVLRFMAARTLPEVAECGQAFLVQGNPGAWSGKLRPEFPISWSIH